ncbi:uncharacterized protein ACA1_122190 [Acanthamoeba castellanii str. Neff]|uniref:Uncharacterized protein n=1 Tax=Acanthamoeba castellanii (strain ATCC 30010 / Neff) TaxID=1257118 RepID=L8GFF9_ACACF|nr:uncharacterized protein ACA1_122190 [Acanthamoeba castellanii str. Neff]ELR11468.1 hypothetical protein ACA1_122190 [Acanthamoeba castellanii str. Neff]
MHTVARFPSGECLPKWLSASIILLQLVACLDCSSCSGHSWLRWIAHSRPAPPNTCA